MRLLFLVLLFASIPSYADECSAYQEIENNYQCGTKGYPLKFGYKYCRKFIDNQDQFSPQGQAWLALTRECLIAEVESFSVSSCRELKKLAFDSHGECFERAGFCNLAKEDRKELYKMIIPQFWRVRLIVDGINLLKSCKD